MQNRDKMLTIALPWLGHSPICPIADLKTLLIRYSAIANDPLFRIHRSHGAVPLTDSVARNHLKRISNYLSFDPSLTFHDFRRSGTTWDPPYKILCSMAPGDPMLSGHIYILPLPFHHPFLLLSNSYMFDLAVWWFSTTYRQTNQPHYFVYCLNTLE